MALKSEILMRFKATQTSTYDVANPSFQPVVEKIIQLTDGVLANQADLLYIDTATLAPSAFTDYDLSGTTNNAFGVNFVAAKIVAHIVLADAGNTHNVHAGGAAANQFVGAISGSTQYIKVSPGGVYLVAGPGLAGIGSVTAGTGDLYRIANGGAVSSVTYTLVVIGRSS